MKLEQARVRLYEALVRFTEDAGDRRDAIPSLQAVMEHDQNCTPLPPARLEIENSPEFQGLLELASSLRSLHCLGSSLLLHRGFVEAIIVHALERANAEGDASEEISDAEFGEAFRMASALYGDEIEQVRKMVSGTMKKQAFCEQVLMRYEKFALCVFIDE